MGKALLAVFICFPHCGFQVLLVTIISAFFPRSLFEQPSLPHGSLGRRFNLNPASALGYLHVAFGRFLANRAFFFHLTMVLSRRGWDGPQFGMDVTPPSLSTPVLASSPPASSSFKSGNRVGTLSPIAKAGYTVSAEAISK